MYPRYKDIQIPLMVEILKRGGDAKPADLDSNGNTIYDVLADYFNLPNEARNKTYYNTHKHKEDPKWPNIIRFVRNDLIKLGYLKSEKYGVWSITEAGRNFISDSTNPTSTYSLESLESKITIDEFLEYLENREVIGDEGEQFVLQYEINRLTKHGRRDLAEKVIHISRVNVAAGFDIKSFDTQGVEIAIEVKTTTQKAAPFIQTENERLTASRLKHLYYIYRVTRIRSNSPKSKLYLILGS